MNSNLYPWETPEYLQALSPGQQMAIRARSWIESNPRHWDQTNYHCGTSHCFAGVVEMLADGLDPQEEYDSTCTVERARLSLGLDYWVAGILWFSPYLTLDNIRDLVKAYTAPLEQILSLVEKHQNSNFIKSNFITYIFCTIIERPDKHTIGLPENLKEEAEIRHYTFVNSRYIDEDED